MGGVYTGHKYQEVRNHQDPSQKLPTTGHESYATSVPRHTVGKALHIRTEAWTPTPPLICPKVRRTRRHLGDT